MKKENSTLKKYTIEDLSELTGYSRRTIRFYIQENIVEPPAGRGRGGFYFESHLKALKKIKELQDKGLNLDSIRIILNEGSLDMDSNKLLIGEAVEREVWAKYEISEGIELNIRKDIELENNKKINAIIKLLKVNMKEIEND